MSARYLRLRGGISKTIQHAPAQTKCREVSLSKTVDLARIEQFSQIFPHASRLGKAMEEDKQLGKEE